MRGEETHERMPYLRRAGCRFQEAVAAVTGVLDEAVALTDGAHPVAEQTAEIPHFLGELRPAGKSVGVARKHQRVPASYARVLVDAAAVGDEDVGVMPQKARKRMANVGQGPVFRQVFVAAPAPSHRAGRPAEDLVVDSMSPQRAAELIEPHTR
jgi:hypothetical protein